jgi:sortase (surface protein transpeptidase)
VARPTWSVPRHRTAPAGNALSVVAATLSAVVLLGAIGLATNAFGARAIIPRAAHGAIWAVPAPSSAPAANTAKSASTKKVTPPTNVRIPKIKVNTSIIPLTLDTTGALEAPTSFTQVGWYAQGTAPGDIGPAILAGHYDNAIRGTVFYQLRLLKAGDLVQVRRGGKWLDFTVVYWGEYSKQDFPTEKVYGPTPDSELRLITCGGTFNGRIGSYDDNIVVYAVATK